MTTMLVIIAITVPTAIVAAAILIASDIRAVAEEARGIRRCLWNEGLKEKEALSKLRDQ